MLQQALRTACHSTSIHIQNFGKGSRTLVPNNTFSYHRTPEYRNAVKALQTSATSLLVFLGTNDVKPVHWRSTEYYLASHESLLTVLCSKDKGTTNGHKALDHVWLVIPPPVFPNPNTWKPSESQVPVAVNGFLGRINASRLETDVAPALRSIVELAQAKDAGAEKLAWRREATSRCVHSKVHLVDLRETFSFLLDTEHRLRNGTGTKEDMALAKTYFFDGVHPSMKSQKMITKKLLDRILEEDDRAGAI